MDIKFVNPFLQAVIDIMPQLGFKEVNQSRVTSVEQELPGQGVTIILGLSEQLRGNVAYNMTREDACRIASTMMMGAPVAELDELAQSAVSELGNMLTANAATNLSSAGFNVNISSPSLVIGDDFRVKISNKKYLCVEFVVDSIRFDLNIAIEP